MKFTLNWLKQPLNTDASLEEIDAALTNIGLEVEEIEDRAKTFAPFKVAYVEAAEKHPDADKLQVCTVKTADGTFQVVCGAPNARAGMKGIFAPEGTYIPGLDLTLKKASIRGVESCGMLVSEREMCLSDEHEGIIEVDDRFEIGTPMAEVFGLDDPVIDIALTPNRADCAGVYGIARDLAAAGLGTLRPIVLKETDTYTPANPDAKKTGENLGFLKIKGSFKSPVNVSIEDTDGCPLFLGRYIKGVKNGPSPEWLQNLLKSVGLRPISALVDITNFMSLDHARPLHVYDADKLSGHIAVRKTKGGESFDALNDKSYEAVSGAVGIFDDSGILGFGGIVGGTSSGCTDETVNVFVECAYFKPERIARTGRDMGIDSDARYRFERGVDPEFTVTGMDLATQMILDICGGEPSELVTAGEMPDWKRSISYDPAYLKQLIGLEVDAAKQIEILSALGFSCEKKGDAYEVAIPPWRGDVMGRADLAEEVIRIIGFDQIPSVSVHSETTVAGSAETPMLTKTRMARNSLAARGMDECVTWSFMNRERAEQFSSNDNIDLDALTLKNAISSELDVMRPSILPNLIEAAKANDARGFKDAALCEVGPVFQSLKPEGQQIIAAGIRAGNAGPRNWSDNNAARAVDAFDAKADAMAALAACGAPAENAQVTRDVPGYFHPGRSGALQLGKNVLAYFGELHPALLDEMDVKMPVVGFEIFLQNIPEARKKPGTEKPYLKLEPLQPLSRDFAFLVDDAVSADDLIRAAKSADKKLIVDAYVFDVYAGKGIENGLKSVALSVTLQPVGATLTDADIEAVSKSVIEAVVGKTGGTLRS